MKRNRKFTLIMMGLVLLNIFFVTRTVEAGEQKRRLNEKKYYAALEQTYVSEIRESLQKYGITNSGINMTYVSDGGVERSYRVVIHNRQLKWLTPDRRHMLLTEIGEIPFPADNCSCFHEFVADKKL